MNRITCAFTLACVIAVGSSLVRAEDETKPPASAPAATQPTKTYEAKDFDALKAAEGQTVTVKGTVSRVGASRGGSIIFINFVGVDRDGFVAIARTKAQDAMKDAVKSDPADYLKDKPVEITGPIKLYRDKPEIEIMTVDQIKVTSAATSKPAEETKQEAKEKEKNQE